MPEIKSFVPMTGRGAFDCNYIPNTKMMTITVKVFAEFENRPNEGVSWTESDKSKFKLSAQESVQRNWNGMKHRFINRQSNPVETVTPIFSVQFVPKSQAAVLMRVPRYASAYGPGNLARCDSYVGLEQVNTGNIHAQASAMVHSESTKPINVKLTEAQNVSRDERLRIEAIINGLKLNNITLDPDGSLTPQVKVALANFSTQVKLGPPSRPIVPIIVDAFFNQNLGVNTTNAIKQGGCIRNALRAFHLPNPIELRWVNDLSLQNQGHIKINPDLSFETAFNDDMWMDIFAHEYGHMLGLPDEYDKEPPPDSIVPKDVAIHRFISMNDSFGTKTPVMGRMTTSIMCKGRDLLPCHMVTALQALCALTGDSNWRVG
ncbi:MAG: hypothetical protein KUG81_00455 [Gammaproteobacteria bacterium]|nr:hypothetical protein [Gammaproteobacteria bacterium]